MRAQEVGQCVIKTVSVQTVRTSRDRARGSCWRWRPRRCLSGSPAESSRSGDRRRSAGRHQTSPCRPDVCSIDEAWLRGRKIARCGAHSAGVVAFTASKLHCSRGPRCFWHVAAALLHFHCLHGAAREQDGFVTLPQPCPCVPDRLPAGLRGATAAGTHNLSQTCQQLEACSWDACLSCDAGRGAHRSSRSPRTLGASWWASLESLTASCRFEAQFRSVCTQQSEAFPVRRSCWASGGELFAAWHKEGRSTAQHKEQERASVPEAWLWWHLALCRH